MARTRSNALRDALQSAAQTNELRDLHQNKKVHMVFRTTKQDEQKMVRKMSPTSEGRARSPPHLPGRTSLVGNGRSSRFSDALANDYDLRPLVKSAASSWAGGGRMFHGSAMKTGLGKTKAGLNHCPWRSQSYGPYSLTSRGGSN